MTVSIVLLSLVSMYLIVKLHSTRRELRRGLVSLKRLTGILGEMRADIDLLARAPKATDSPSEEPK